VKTCDRQTFMRLVSGILMERTADGKVYIGDTQEAHDTFRAHENGEEVGLTVDGKLVSTIKDHIEREVEL